MKIYLSCTSNLGDFLNSLPVLSGIYNSYGKIDFAIKRDMRKFNGIKEFLMYQGIFNTVIFDDEPSEGQYLNLSSWTREDKGHPHRPIETCRYENWIKDNYKLDFKVDDSFILKVEDIENYEWNPGYYGGDRWSGPNIDGRRKSWTLAHLDNITFLDYNKTMMENAYVIKNCNDPFISTFTGISVIADLLNKNQIVLWGDDLRMWDNKPIEYSFQKHFYGNRNSKLMYIGDFEENGL